MGAASYLEGQRFTRPRTRKKYYQWVLSFQGYSLDNQGIKASSQDFLLETLMLRFRLAEGVHLSKLSREFGQKTLENLLIYLHPYQQLGWVELINQNGVATPFSDNQKLPIEGYLRLTDPEGFLFSNTVLSTLFSKISNSIHMDS